jgi:hypothetical protein
VKFFWGQGRQRKVQRGLQIRLGCRSGKMCLVHLNAASLNSLTEILRQANPLYNECRSILNDFDGGSGKG